MKKIRTLIVEDDNNAADLLKFLLYQNFEYIDIISICNTLTDAVQIIDSEKPDLVFLDIELPDGNGFELINLVKYKQFEVIFVTAFNQYAVKAFEFAALHYLLKPVTKESLAQALERYRHKANFREMQKKIDVLKSNISNNFSKIMLPTGNGMEVFELEDILRCEADDNYTIVYLTSKKYIIITKNLSSMEVILSNNGFFRVHRKFLINLNYIKKFIKNKKNPSIILSDGFEVPLSEHRYDDFVEVLEQFVKIV